MAAVLQPDMSQFFSNKEVLRKLAREVNARSGIIDDPTATAEKAQKMMQSQGVRAEDNTGSHELMRMRYGNDWEAT